MRAPAMDVDRMEKIILMANQQKPEEAKEAEIPKPKPKKKKKKKKTRQPKLSAFFSKK